MFAHTRSSMWLTLGLTIAVLHLPIPTSAEMLTIDRIFDSPSLSGPRPRGVAISPNGRMVGYLKGSPGDQYHLDLWIYDVEAGQSRLAADSRDLIPDVEPSDVEKARRERMRIASYHGILHYEWSPDSRSVLLPLGTALYLKEISPGSDRDARVILEDDDVTDAKVSSTGRYASFVRDQNLYVIDLSSNSERQLTFDGHGTIHNAESEFVAQEEYDQYTGYWWSPNDQWIAFKQFDESPVPITKRMEVYPDRTETVEQRYPYAGDSNVVVRLGLLNVESGETRWVDLGPNRDVYLVRVDWTPDARTLTYQIQSRDQKRLDLVAVNVYDGTQDTLITETSATWINLHDDLRFMKRSDQFLWSSERSGYRHLYLYNRDGSLVRQVTDGDWDVDGLRAVDETNGLAYFTASIGTVLEQQLYGADYTDDSDTHRGVDQYTTGDGWHTATFAKDADSIALFVESYSDPWYPPKYSIRDSRGELLAWLEPNRVEDDDHPYHPYRDHHVVPEFGTVDAEDGTPLQFNILKPPDFDSQRKYPVIIDVYGGPHSQQVRRSWGDLFNVYLAQQGYIIFQLDNRGTSNRGRPFEDALYHRLGDVEVRDQLAGIRWLRQQPYVDSTRIAVNGWSYGGYMAVMMLAKASDWLAGGVAGAPVTDWRFYDTHYTERYLGTPQDNGPGYDSSAVFSVLEGLRSPLLLIHGMADDNVLFQNSTELMSALQKQGTQFQMMTYPGGKHGLSTPEMKKHYHHLIDTFFRDKLRP